MADYYYLHETPNVAYTVEAKPPPADSSKAVFRANSPAGKTLHTEPALKKSGQGTIAFPLTPKGIGVGDSPIFVEFTFEKAGAKPPTIKRLAVLALAEPAVRTIEAPPEASPDEQVKLVVTAWAARVYERPGSPTLWDEEKPGRISTDDRSKVKWRLAGKELTVQGEKVRAGGIKKEHLGTYVEAVAWLGEKPDPSLPATASIAVPLLAAKGPDEVDEGDSIGVVASIEPSIEGEFAWELTSTDKAKVEASNAPSVLILGLLPSDATGDVKLACTFTSKATGKQYRVEHPVTVKPLPLDTEAEHEEPHVFGPDADLDEPEVVAPEADIEDEPAFDHVAEIEGGESESLEAETEEDPAYAVEAEHDEPWVLETSVEVVLDGPLETGVEVELDGPLEVETEDEPAFTTAVEPETVPPLRTGIGFSLEPETPPPADEVPSA